jgi:hypothetical protein
MSDNYYFAGSIYKRVKRGRDVEACIRKADGLDGHLMTSYHGKPALVTDGKLYLWAGKIKGFKSINWHKT